MPPYLYIDTEEDFWEDDALDEPGRGMSGWLTNPTDGAFRLPYRPELKFGVGDYTVVQTFNVLASGGARVATYDDYTTGDGVRLSQTSNVFSVESGDVSFSLPSNPMDGTNRYFMVERESGVAVRAYLDDFETVLASGSDAGTDISNTEPLDLGYDGVTYADGMVGLTLVFHKLLEEYEKDDVFYWIESGYSAESEPEWLRTDATLYINPNDPVQRAEYAANESVINLGLTVPDKIYVRYDFTSVDGVSNPVLSKNDIRLSNLSLHRQVNELAYDKEPFSLLPLGHGQSPQVARYHNADAGQVVTIPVGELGNTWVNNDFTVAMWARILDTGTIRYLIAQGTVGAADAWNLSFTAADRLSLNIGGTTAITPAAPIGQELLEKTCMLVVTRTGNNFGVFIDGQSSDTNTSASTVSAMTADLLYGGAATSSADSLLGPMHIWKRALSLSEIQTLYNESPESYPVLAGDSITLTDSFSTTDLNWERH